MYKTGIETAEFGNYAVYLNERIIGYRPTYTRAIDFLFCHCENNDIDLNGLLHLYSEWLKSQAPAPTPRTFAAPTEAPARTAERPENRDIKTINVVSRNNALRRK